MGKRSCSSESYINHPMKSSSLERNVLEISQNLFFKSVIFFITRLPVRYLPLPDFIAVFFFFYFFFFLNCIFGSSRFFGHFFLFCETPLRVEEEFVDLFLLTHTGLNLRTIVAMYDRRRPVRDQIATARGFIYYSEHFQPMPVLKFENCYFFRICTDDN